jgi:hypothetical protein
MAGMLFRPRFAIEKKTGVTETISSEVDNNVLLFRHCKDSCFTLTGSAIKIVMDHCENFRLVLDKDGKSILAGTLEMVHCKKVCLPSSFLPLVPYLFLPFCLSS